MEDWTTAPISPADRVVLVLAVQLTRAPGQVRAEALEPLRAAGLDDAAIHDAVQVIAYYNYINRVASGLGVPLEE